MGFQKNVADTETILTEKYEKYYRLAYSLCEMNMMPWMWSRRALTAL